MATKTATRKPRTVKPDAIETANALDRAIAILDTLANKAVTSSVAAENAAETLRANRAITDAARSEIAANRAANDRAEALAKQAERRAARKAERLTPIDTTLPVAARMEAYRERYGKTATEPAPTAQTATQTVSGPILDVTRQDALVEITSTRTGKTVHIQIATQSELATFAPGKRIATHLHEDGSYTGFAWVNPDGLRLFRTQQNNRLYAYLIDMLENPSEHLRRGVKYGVTITGEV